MDGYRDLHLVPVPARYYAPSRYPSGYGFEGRSSYSLAAGDPLYSSYSRAARDAYAGYGASVVYQPELVPLPHYLSPRRRMNPKRPPPAQSNGNKRRLPPAESLNPKKKPFKKTQKSVHVEALSSQRKKSSEGKPVRNKEQKDAGKPQKASVVATLAKETEELHKLFRTGVDSGKKVVKPIAKQAAGTPGKNNSAATTVVGQKRKAEGQKREFPSRKITRANKRKFAKEKQQQAGKKDEKSVEVPKPKVEKAEPAPLTEEEKKEMELALELQSTACKVVIEFLGIPEKSMEPELEVEKSEPAQAAEDEVQEGATVAEAQDKPEEAPKPPPTLTAEEETELEEKGYNFFSKMLEENSELRKLYLDKKDAGTFECLVCRSVDPETSKKFANLTSLVMHTSMRKQKRPEHRGYGKAICDILGWESLRPKRPAKQAKVDEENTKEVEAEKVVGEGEEKQEGANDNK